MSFPLLNNVKYSILDLATVNQGDSVSQTFVKSSTVAQNAEKLGYTRYWLSEHHNMENVASASTAILISHIAAATKTIRVGSGGIMLPNHSTLSVAEDFGTLEYLFPHRIDLGLGRAPGTDQQVAVVLRRGQPLMDYNFEMAIKQLQRYFSKANAHSTVRALPGEGLDIPLYILGSSTDSAHLAARLGLPYAFAGHFAPTQMSVASQVYHTEFQPSDYCREPYFIACVNIAVADTKEEANYLFRSHLQTVINILSNQRQPLMPPEAATLQLQSEQMRQMLLTWTSLSFVGDTASVGQDLSVFVQENKVNEIMAYTNIYDLEAKIKSYELFSTIFH